MASQNGAGIGPDHQLDQAGQAILHVLGKAADAVENTNRRAIDMAQRLSHQLRTAEGRIAELEAEIATCRQQAERAEEWLHRVYAEIVDRFLRQDDNRSGTPQRANGR